MFKQDNWEQELENQYSEFAHGEHSNLHTVLASEVASCLRKWGIFGNVTHRTKSFASLKHKVQKKLSNGDLQNGNRVKDLIGVRVCVYFQEDMEVCKEMFAQTFGMPAGSEWKTYQIDDNNFEPMKNNGIFKIPAKIAMGLNEEIWDFCVDKVFEIQIRTIFFEGWHEVEHDFRYKLKDDDEGKSIWSENKEYSRRLNSIIATLELCDQSMHQNFEDFSHALYKQQKWDEMLRIHFRMRFQGQKLSDEMAVFLTRDYEQCLETGEDSIAKRLYRTNKIEVINALEKYEKTAPLRLDDLVALLNPENEMIQSIAKETSNAPTTGNVSEPGIQELEEMLEDDCEE